MILKLELRAEGLKCRYLEHSSYKNTLKNVLSIEYYFRNEQIFKILKVLIEYNYISKLGTKLVDNLKVKM